jgi:hypothetical protein
MKSLLCALLLFAGCGYDLNNPLEPCLDPESGFHVCGNKCVDNTDPKSCGSSCTPCESANGMASCDGSKCGLTCNPGFHLCGGKCAADTDPNNCGPSCMICPSVNGKPACDAATGMCGLACNSGFHLCSGVCKASNSVNSCGTRCSICPSVPNANTLCMDFNDGKGPVCAYQCLFTAPCNGGTQCCGSTQTCNASDMCQ